ncbi:MAG: hypothetical protein ACLFU0_01760 [Alphaproteobacteria bacterium]
MTAFAGLRVLWATMARGVVPTPALAEARSVPCLVVFALACVLVMTEERHDLHKSKPVRLAVGGIWALVAWTAPIPYAI